MLDAVIYIHVKDDRNDIDYIFAIVPSHLFTLLSLEPKHVI